MRPESWLVGDGGRRTLSGSIGRCREEMRETGGRAKTSTRLSRRMTMGTNRSQLAGPSVAVTRVRSPPPPPLLGT